MTTPAHAQYHATIPLCYYPGIPMPTGRARAKGMSAWARWAWSRGTRGTYADTGARYETDTLAGGPMAWLGVPVSLRGGLSNIPYVYAMSIHYTIHYPSSHRVTRASPHTSIRAVPHSVSVYSMPVYAILPCSIMRQHYTYIIHYIIRTLYTLYTCVRFA